MPAYVKVGGQSPLAIDALAERDAGQPARKVVGPIVVDANKFPNIAARLVADQRSLMSAPVDDGVDRAILSANDDDGRVSNIGGLVIARIRDFTFEAEEIPRGTAKNFSL